ncbi:hypothetical protein [Celeribacter sp. PS-C1]|uniref:hypothetical protein n=1 Tax=Celeribacter sp. PS-C1 TaxID=2820813 RepID=UPI001CA47195|nr:hypothetical protein [Celeribacter sp. PS-C1]MBW6419514.1 hypothetical protein [Celeribacter sp. PS-C1]
MAQDRLITALVSPELHQDFASLAKSKGMSASELARGYLLKGMTLEAEKAGFPAMAEIGDESSMREYLQLRFGLAPTVANELVTFAKHLLATTPPAEVVMQTALFLSDARGEAPLYSSIDEMRGSLLACGLSNEQVRVLVNGAKFMAEVEHA